MIALPRNPDELPPPDGYGQAHTDPPEGYHSWPEYMQDISEQAHAALPTAAKPAAKRLLVFRSGHHQNTARVAEAMAEVLRADCLTPEACPYGQLDRCEVLGIGSGIYYGRVHAELWRWVRDLADRSSPKPAVFIFSTSGLPIFARFWHHSLRTALTRKGFVVRDEFACRGFDTWGPLWLAGGLNRHHPDEQDLARARDFARRIADVPDY